VYYSLFSFSSDLQYSHFICSSHSTIPCKSLLCFIHHFCHSSATINHTKKSNFQRTRIYKQMSEHKQLLISSFILLILAMPRLIISLISGCVDPSNNPWLYLSAYFISFTPPMLIFIVFVLPSELYRKTFKKTMIRS